MFTRYLQYPVKMWQGVSSTKHIQRLDYLKIINSKDYSHQMVNRLDYS